MALRSLADAGGLVLFLSAIALAAVGLYRQWWVDGPHYREKIDELEAAKREVATQRKTIDRLTVQLARERRHRSSDHEA